MHMGVDYQPIKVYFKINSGFRVYVHGDGYWSVTE